jgi:uncharacterized protein YprB with RNaseH-like and TPR domain
MRDLASRLRAIVQQERGRASNRAGDSGIRELTYVPAEDGIEPAAFGLPESGDRALDVAASLLGGTAVRTGAHGFVAVDRAWDAHEYHGRRRLESYTIAPDAPIRLFDPRVDTMPDWCSRIVFFDIETTGLSGGAGTVAFLAGCGWFEDGGFRVRQFFLAGPAGESSMLDALARVFDDATLLVTYNGRTFDVPTMDTRWAFHRRDSAATELPHFDMLPPARRLWGGARSRDLRSAGLQPGVTSCTLSSIERSILGFHRLGDVPGFEIPTRYFQFLRTGDPRVVNGVLEHNRHDVISLALVTAHALQLAADGPDACREPCEQAALGRLYERAGDLSRATYAYEQAARQADRELRAHVLSRLAILHRRAARHREAAAAWQDVFESTWSSHGPESPLGWRAAEALAIHHEHRARDLDRARRYAQALERNSRGRLAENARHRLSRLDRKLTSRQTSGNDPVPGSLFPSG